MCREIRCRKDIEFELLTENLDYVDESKSLIENIVSNFIAQSECVVLYKGKKFYFSADPFLKDYVAIKSEGGTKYSISILDNGIYISDEHIQEEFEKMLVIDKEREDLKPDNGELIV